MLHLCILGKMASAMVVEITLQMVTPQWVQVHIPMGHLLETLDIFLHVRIQHPAQPFNIREFYYNISQAGTKYRMCLYASGCFLYFCHTKEVEVAEALPHDANP